MTRSLNSHTIRYRDASKPLRAVSILANYPKISILKFVIFFQTYLKILHFREKKNFYFLFLFVKWKIMIMNDINETRSVIIVAKIRKLLIELLLLFLKYNLELISFFSLNELTNLFFFFFFSIINRINYNYILFYFSWKYQEKEQFCLVFILFKWFSQIFRFYCFLYVGETVVDFPSNLEIKSDWNPRQFSLNCWSVFLIESRKI
jgi:hypothetical protein